MPMIFTNGCRVEFQVSAFCCSMDSHLSKIPIVCEYFHLKGGLNVNLKIQLGLCERGNTGGGGGGHHHW